MKQLPREMTSYEKIKYLLEMWVYKGVEVIVWQWDTRKGKYFVKSLEEIEEGNLIDIVNEKNKNNLCVTSITPIPNPPKLLPVGTKVRVFEEYVDSDWWDMYKQERDIKDVFDCCYKIWIIGIRWVWAYEVPFRAVCPVWED